MHVCVNALSHPVLLLQCCHTISAFLMINFMHVCVSMPRRTLSYCSSAVIPFQLPGLQIAPITSRVGLVEERKYYKALMVKVAKKIQNIEISAAFNKWYELIDIKRDKEQHKSK